MPRGLSNFNVINIAKPVMWQRWLLECGDLRLCSLDHVIVDKRVYIPHGFTVELRDNHGATCVVDDSKNLYGDEFIIDSVVILSMLYGPRGNGEFTGDLNIIRKGFISSAPRENNKITLDISAGGYSRFPNERFNNLSGSYHSPPNGARVTMPDGVVVLTTN